MTKIEPLNVDKPVLLNQHFYMFSNSTSPSNSFLSVLSVNLKGSRRRPVLHSFIHRVGEKGSEEFLCRAR